MSLITNYGFKYIVRTNESSNASHYTSIGRVYLLQNCDRMSRHHRLHYVMHQPRKEFSNETGAQLSHDFVLPYTSSVRLQFSVSFPPTCVPAPQDIFFPSICILTFYYFILHPILQEPTSSPIKQRGGKFGKLAVLFCCNYAHMKVWILYWFKIINSTNVEK